VKGGGFRGACEAGQPPEPAGHTDRQEIDDRHGADATVVTVVPSPVPCGCAHAEATALQDAMGAGGGKPEGGKGAGGAGGATVSIQVKVCVQERGWLHNNCVLWVLALICDGAMVALRTYKQSWHAEWQ
jgi:hypothetical protein